MSQAQAMLLRCRVPVGAAVDVDTAVGPWFRAMGGVSHLSSAWLRAGIETEARAHPVQGGNGRLEAGARRDPVVGGASSSASSGAASASAAHGGSAAAASVGGIVAVARCVLGGFRRTGGGGVTFENPLPFGAQLLVAERRLCVDGARRVFSDYEVEKLLHNFCSPPVEKESGLSLLNVSLRVVHWLRKA